MKKTICAALSLALCMSSAMAFGLEDGKYVTSGRGHEGMVHVATVFQNGAIKSVEVLTHDETIGIGNYAADVIPGRIVENQSVAIDTVSGATMTSYAVISAVKEAITQAGGDIKSFSVKPETTLSETSVEETVDLVIMGAGTSGLMAANRALEKGLNVLVFEKMDIPGGAMPMTYSGLFVADSHMQNAYAGENAPTVDQYIAIMKSSADPANAVRGEDMPYWTRILENSGEMVDWLADIGVGFATMGIRYGTTPFLAPGPYQGGAGYAMEYLADHFVKNGGRIIYGTPVTELIQDESGRVTGLKAEGKDGTHWSINAKVVLLASGGFGANSEMVAEYYPQYAGQFINCAKGSTGDGIKLGLAAGGTVECMGRTLGAFLSTYQSKYELAFLHYTTPGLIVNVNGDSIGNITKNNHPMLAAAKADPANGNVFYYVFDEASRMRTKKCISIGNGLTYGVSYEPIFETGEAQHFASIEEAAQALNLPNLIATIETNNMHSRNDEPDEFGRKNLPLIDDRYGIYMLRVDPTYYLTTGGLAADTEGHILTADGAIIPGLYGAGDVLGALEEKDGKHYGMGFDSAMIFGYIVGNEIAAQEFGL